MISSNAEDYLIDDDDVSSEQLGGGMLAFVHESTSTLNVMAGEIYYSWRILLLFFFPLSLSLEGICLILNHAQFSFCSLLKPKC